MPKHYKEMIDEIKKNKSFDLKTDAKRLPGESTEDYLKRIGLTK